MRTNIFFALLLLLAVTACKTKSTQLTVLQPAQFSVPDHINNIAVVDRSKPSNGWLNALEGVLTGEGIGQDRQCRERAVSGLTEALHRTPRFKVISTGIELPGSKAGVNLPAPLSWNEIERICKDYNADALVCIESFDTDNNSSTRIRQTKRKNKEGVQTLVTDYTSEMRVNVRVGWRFYDPKSRRIFDEFITTDQASRSGSGSTERAALSNLPSTVNVTRDISRAVGRSYGMRIAPVFVNVSRRFYTKAKDVNDQMAQAARFAQAQNWDKASDIWTRMVDRNKSNPEVAGRAAYNMAVAAESKGNLDIALEWAEKSWTAYGNKKAKGYIQTLRQRQYDSQRVSEQMGNKP